MARCGFTLAGWGCATDLGGVVGLGGGTGSGGATGSGGLGGSGGSSTIRRFRGAESNDPLGRPRLRFTGNSSFFSELSGDCSHFSELSGNSSEFSAIYSCAT